MISSDILYDESGAGLEKSEVKEPKNKKVHKKKFYLTKADVGIE